MIIVTDIETYRKYNGTTASRELILNDSDEDSKEYFLKTISKGKGKNCFFPVLNARQYSLGRVVTEKGKIHKFTNPEDHLNFILELAEKLSNHGEKLYVYGHYHIYDFYGYMNSKLTDNKLKLINTGKLFAIYDNTIYFLDSSSFNKGSLKDLGEMLEFPKLEMPKKVKNIEELGDYCTRDCEIVLKFILNLKEQLGILGFKPKKLLTAGSLAMSTFLTYSRRNNTHFNFMRSGQVFLSERHKKTRVAFRGARNEAFQVGKFENCTLMDINSLYPHIMATMDFPDLRKPLFMEKPALNNWKDIKQLIGVIQCTISINTKDIPLLAVRIPVENKKTEFLQVCPSKGNFKGTWAIEEIKEAEKLGQIKILKIDWVEVYKKNDINPFTDYINKMYALKISNPIMKNTCKLLLNNLFGKFAQYRRDIETKWILRKDKVKWEKQGWNVKTMIEEKYLMEKDMGEYIPKFYNPLISLRITALARIYLHKHLKMIPKEDLLYTDTDSILFKGDHLNKFKVDNKLGNWKIETSGVADIRKEKDYSINDQIKISGLPKRSLNKETLKQKVINIKKMISIKEALKMGDLSKAGKFRDTQFSFGGRPKKDVTIPDYYDETTDYYIIGEKKK